MRIVDRVEEEEEVLEVVVVVVVLRPVADITAYRLDLPDPIIILLTTIMVAIIMRIWDGRGRNGMVEIVEIVEVLHPLWWIHARVGSIPRGKRGQGLSRRRRATKTCSCHLRLTLVVPNLNITSNSIKVRGVGMIRGGTARMTVVLLKTMIDRVSLLLRARACPILIHPVAQGMIMSVIVLVGGEAGRRPRRVAVTMGLLHH